MILVDTNILLRVVDPSSKDHTDVVASLHILKRNQEPLVYVPQVAYEFWAVATRPTEANGLGWTADRTALELASFRQLFTFLADLPTLYLEWESLVILHACYGRVSFDARLVAAMRTHSIPKLLTFNGSDFTRFPGIEVVDPRRLAANHPTNATSH